MEGLNTYRHPIKETPKYKEFKWEILSQVEYDAITPDPDTHYFIDAVKAYKGTLEL